MEKEQFKTLEDAVRDLEESLWKAEKAKDDIDEVLKEIETNEGAFEDKITAYESLIERLADTRNWIDGRYAPQIKELLYENVPDLCSAVLRENQ